MDSCANSNSTKDSGLLSLLFCSQWGVYKPSSCRMQTKTDHLSELKFPVVGQSKFCLFGLNRSHLWCLYFWGVSHLCMYELCQIEACLLSSADVGMLIALYIQCLVAVNNDFSGWLQEIAQRGWMKKHSMDCLHHLQCCLYFSKCLAYCCS